MAKRRSNLAEFAATSSRPVHYALAILACVATAAVAGLLHAYLDAPNTVMLFLLEVALVAVYLGRAPAVLAALCSVAFFDFFFVPPRFSFTVADVQYLVTFGVMLVVALIISHLAGGLRRQAKEAEARERQTRSLYDLAKTLAAAFSAQQVRVKTCDWLRANAGAEALLLVRGDDPGARLTAVNGDPAPDEVLLRVAETVVAAKQAVATDQLGDDSTWLVLPLQAAERTCGVLAIRVAHAQAGTLKMHRTLLEALASVVAATLERVRSVDLAQGARMRASTERLRSSILSALSHDVRTPLTTLYGLADQLAMARPDLPPEVRDALLAIRDQSHRLSGMVSNLLDMARLQAGTVSLRKEWQPLEELVGSGIQALGAALQDHQVVVELPPDLPLLELDAVLMERVFANLLENAAKYSPAGSPITIRARLGDSVVETAVLDRGRGFPAQPAGQVFDLFVRGEAESAVPGMGVGLAICRAIVEAHGGEIRASNREGGGACVTFTLPRGNPPPIEIESNAVEEGSR